MKKIIMIAVFVLLISTLGFANTIIVDWNGSGDYTTIQAGINAARDGDMVLVYTGIYYENINFNGKKIIVTSEFIENNDQYYITNTVIDGLHNGSTVSFYNGEDSKSHLCGFTIRNGAGSHIEIEGELRQAGGGILIWNYSSPKLYNCIIQNNTAYRGGGDRL